MHILCPGYSHTCPPGQASEPPDYFLMGSSAPTSQLGTYHILDHLYNYNTPREWEILTQNASLKLQIFF